jgi:predicted MFS family arabinose efflux permease
LLFWIDGITCLAAAGLLFWLVPARKIDTDHKDTSQEQKIESPWRDTFFIFLLLLMLCMGMVFVQVFSTWPLFLREVYSFLENQIGLLLAFNAFLIVLIEMPLIHKVENKNPLRVMALGALFLFAGFGIIPLNSSFLFIMFTVVLWTIGEMLIFPIMSSFIANRASDQNRGKYMGMYTFTFALSFVVGPAIGSFIYDHLGPNTLWFGIGVSGVIVLILFRLMYDYFRLSEK